MVKGNKSTVWDRRLSSIPPSSDFSLRLSDGASKDAHRRWDKGMGLIQSKYAREHDEGCTYSGHQLLLHSHVSLFHIAGQDDFKKWELELVSDELLETAHSSYPEAWQSNRSNLRNQSHHEFVGRRALNRPLSDYHLADPCPVLHAFVNIRQNNQKDCSQ